MGIFQRNVNVYLGLDSAASTISELAGAVVTMIRKKNMDPCKQDDDIDRTMLLTPHGDRWLTLVDDVFDQEPRAALEFANDLMVQIPRPILVVEINDNDVSEMILLHEGCADRLAVPHLHTPLEIRTDSPWRVLLSENGSDVRYFDRLDDLANALGLTFQAWLQAIDEYENDATERGEILWFRKKSVVHDKPNSGHHGSALSIPAFLCGHPRKVARRTRKIIDKLIATKSWTRAMEGESFVPISEAPFVLMMEGPPFEDDDNMVALYVFPESLLEAAVRYKQTDLLRELVLNGMDEFWVCLAALACGTILLPKSRDVEERRRFQKKMLEKLLKWWEPLCTLEVERRYFGAFLAQQWPRWATKVWIACGYLEVPKAEFDLIYNASPSRAGELLRNWLAKAGKTP